MSGTALNAARRARELDQIAGTREVDVLVIGGGITGAGIALDAASRGFSTVLVEKHDLAFGTSRWSSKLVHGGLRYLASGQVGIAYESAAERHLLMTRIAPHLTRPLAQILPLHAPHHVGRAAVVGTGYVLGDALRRAVRTPGRVLRHPSFIDAAAVRRAAPAVRDDGLRGGILGWDGQLIDDARLVVAVARTAAGFGARILTRVSAERVDGTGATLRDELTGQTMRLSARAVLAAAGVWAGSIDPGVRLRPSRGTHLVLDGARLSWSDASLTVPLPGSRSRVIFTVPAPHGRVYVGLTDVPADEGVPDVAEPTEDEIRMLLDTLNTVLSRPIDRAEVLGAFAGLRPLLLPDAQSASGETADVSRRHAIIESGSGALSVVGGKLTTYRRMAQDGVDEAVRRRGLAAIPSRTRELALVGAWPRERLASVPAPARLVRRFGAEAPLVAAGRTALDGPRGVTGQELAWGVDVEGALTVDDLLDRRTRLGLVAEDRIAGEDAAAAAFE